MRVVRYVTEVHCHILSSQVVLSSDLTVIETLAKVCVDHHAGLASTLIQIFCHHQWVLPILIECLSRSVMAEGEMKGVITFQPQNIIIPIKLIISLRQKMSRAMKIWLHKSTSYAIHNV